MPTRGDPGAGGPQMKRVVPGLSLPGVLWVLPKPWGCPGSPTEEGRCQRGGHTELLPVCQSEGLPL